MENNNNGGSKVGGFLQKMFHFRVKVNRKGEPIVNVSSIFGLACLLFAPHMTIVGVVAALLLGYQIHFESEDGNGEIEEQIRRAAQNVKNGAMNAAKSIQTEINRARAQNAPAQSAPVQPTAEQVKAAEKQAEEIVRKAQNSNEQLLQDLASHAEEPMVSNPAATTFHSAYAASAGSVPVLRVSEETGDNPEPTPPAARAGE